MRNHWRTMESLAVAAALCWTGARAMGQADYQAPQYPQYVQYPQGAPPVTPTGPVTLTADQIDQLVGPVALYPDPLLSLIFPAATYPQDVVAAEQWLAATPNPTEADIAAQSWDPSIKGLIHYPTVLKMMSDQGAWTETVGAAFTYQQQDVLASVQRLRAEAQAVQNLQTNAQEQVVADDGSIRIEPVDPDVMYVPQYDPNSVYVSLYPVTYGSGYPIGLWDDNDFNWSNGDVVIGGGWYSGWKHPAAWDQNPPAWDRHPAGWVDSPKPWARNNASSPALRVAPAAVARLSLDRPRAEAGVNPTRGAVRNAPAPQPSGNAFDPAESRDDIQRAQQRARPAVQPLAPVVRPPMMDQRAPEPRAAEAPPAQRSAPAAAPQEPSNNAFSGGSAGDSRAQSARGHASGGRR
jgi:hypothetical protein